MGGRRLAAQGEQLGEIDERGVHGRRIVDAGDPRVALRPDQLPGARVVEAAATETGSLGLNSSLALNGTIATSTTSSESSFTSSVTDTAPATTDPPTIATSTFGCIPMMMQVDYLHCGKRGG